MDHFGHFGPKLWTILDTLGPWGGKHPSPLATGLQVDWEDVNHISSMRHIAPLLWYDTNTSSVHAEGQFLNFLMGEGPCCPLQCSLGDVFPVVFFTIDTHFSH